MNELGKILNELVKGVRVTRDIVREWVKEFDWSELTKEFKLFSEELPKSIEVLSRKLANNGWFIWLSDAGLSFVYESLEKINNNEIKEIDLLLSKHFENEIENIEKELIFNYPSRIIQIKEAFETHRQKLFYSSIPSFLILAEGLCREMYPQIGLYAKHPRKIKGLNGKFVHNPKAWKPVTIDLFDNITSLEIFDEAVLKPLKIKSHITKTIHRPRLKHKQSLNRHLIIHGISSSYGSRLNSLKAISLAHFVHKSLTHINKKTTT